MKKRCCKICKYWQFLLTKRGLCLRFPPVWSEGDQSWYFPETQPDQSACGEWKAKKVKDE